MGHRDPSPNGMNCPYRTGPTGADRHKIEGHVRHGWAGTARFTGTRAITSPRFVAAAARGGIHGRSWLRGYGPDAVGPDALSPGAVGASRQPDAHVGGSPADTLHLPPVADEGTRA